MAPWQQQVQVLDEAGRRQDVVGVARRVGDEQVVHDREEVLPGQAAADQVRVGGDRGGVAVEDEEGPESAGVSSGSVSALPIWTMLIVRVLG